MVWQILFCVFGGLLIMIAPVLTERMSGKRKSLLWTTFIVLGLFYMGIGICLAIDNQKRMDLDKKNIADLKNKTDHLINMFYDREVGAGGTKNIVEMLAKLDKKITISNKSKQGDLKNRANLLSFQILQFLLERQKNEPHRPQPRTWIEDTDRMINYSQETMSLYSLQFAAKVIAIRDELSGKVLQDKELDRFYMFPTNSIGVRIVAERIGALAERLP